MTVQNIFVIVPAYNEEDNLPHLIENLSRFCPMFGLDHQQIVVDDGSSDRTAEVCREAAEDHPVEVITQPNGGPGTAFNTGFNAALDRAGPEDLILTVEADNTSDLCVLNKMVEVCRRGNDVVLASVYGSGRVVGAPMLRKMLSLGANLLMKGIFQIPEVNTFSSFFRLYRADALQDARKRLGGNLIEEPGFVCMVELLIKLHRLGYRIAEVPMLLDSNIRVGDSSMKLIRTSMSYGRVVSRFARWKELT